MPSPFDAPVLNETVASVLLEAASLMGRSLQPELAINGMLALLADRLHLDKGRVLLPEAGHPGSGLLRIHYAHGLSAPERLRGAYALGEGVTGDVMRTGRIALVRDVSREPRYLARVTDMPPRGDEPLAYIAVPIMRDERPMGVLAVQPMRPPHNDYRSDLYALQLIAAMMGQVLRIHRRVEEKTRHLVNENWELRQNRRLEGTAYGIIGDSPPLRDALRQALRAADSQAPVLLTGESGSGKERFARMLHLACARRDRPFICINCAAIPEQLLESELFGHEKGSFTGAISAHSGKFEQARGGTLFLDEIGDMGLELQAKLLRVLADGRIQRLGSEREIATDVRIITATHKDLRQAVNAGDFRLDLYYRLNVIRIQVPSLRQRRDDIRLLASYFLNRENQALGRNAALTPAAIERLEDYPWPGNIRQLENVIKRAVVMGETARIERADIQRILDEEAGLAPPDGTRPAMDEAAPPVGRPYRRIRHEEGEAIRRALHQARGNKTLAAQQLGLTSRQLYYRMAKLGIPLNPD